MSLSASRCSNNARFFYFFFFLQHSDAFLNTPLCRVALVRAKMSPGRGTARPPLAEVFFFFSTGLGYVSQHFHVSRARSANNEWKQSCFFQRAARLFRDFSVCSRARFSRARRFFRLPVLEREDTGHLVITCHSNARISRTRSVPHHGRGVRVSSLDKPGRDCRVRGCL